MKKTLVAVFSASGRTAKVGKKIAELAGADYFEIIPESIYTNADLRWINPRSRSSREMKDPSSRPAIASKVEDMSVYDTVIIGFPIWWGLAPRIIETFLESYDFSGKTIAVFVTSGSSGVGSSDTELHDNVSSGVRWIKGVRINRPDEKQIRQFLEQTG